MSKLKGLPPVYAMSLIESGVRRKHLWEQFNKYDQYYINIVTSSREEDALAVIETSWPREMLQPTLLGHLKAIKLWYDSNVSEVALFVEDDISLDTVQYWNFTWEEFYNHLPSDWECIQLTWIRFGDREAVFRYGDKLRPRCWNDFSATGYMIKREYAKKLLDLYYHDGVYYFDVKGADLDIKPEYALWPTTENILFSSIGAIYSFPLFVEEVDGLASTHQHNVDSGIDQGYGHREARRIVLNWWKYVGQYRPIGEI